MRRPRTRFVRRTAIALLCLLLLAIAWPAHAFDYRQVLEDSLTMPITFDTGYELAHDRLVQTHFSLRIAAPSEGLKVAVHSKSDDRYATILFGAPDGRIAEIMSIFDVALAEGDRETRLSELAASIRARSYPSATKGQGDPFIASLQEIEVAGHQAVELTGAFEELAGLARGRVFLRIVGILPPEGGNGLLVVSEATESLMPLPGPDALATTFVGTALNTFDFIATRDPSGAMRRY